MSGRKNKQIIIQKYIKQYERQKKVNDIRYIEIDYKKSVKISWNIKKIK